MVKIHRSECGCAPFDGICSGSLYDGSKDQKQNEAKTVQTTENTKLNIAVVNEDKAVKLNDKEYNLGASYVKNIERDNSQNWSVLPRGAAESGLADGKYQLMIVIQVTSQRRSWEVNAVNAEKTTVTYKGQRGWKFSG